jgi:hypothetical protein
MESQQQRQGFGFFGQPKKVHQQHSKGGMNGNFLAEEPVHPSSKLQLSKAVEPVLMRCRAVRRGINDAR